MVFNVNCIVACSRNNARIAACSHQDIILTAAYANISARNCNFVVAVARVNAFPTASALNSVISCSERNFILAARIIDKNKIIVITRYNAVAWTVRIERHEIFAYADIDCWIAYTRNNWIIAFFEINNIQFTTARDWNKIISAFSFDYAASHRACDGNFVVTRASNYWRMIIIVRPAPTFSAACDYRIISWTCNYIRDFNVAVVNVVATVADFNIIAFAFFFGLVAVADLNSILPVARLDCLIAARWTVNRNGVVTCAGIYADVVAAVVDIVVVFATLKRDVIFGVGDIVVVEITVSPDVACQVQDTVFAAARIDVGTFAAVFNTVHIVPSVNTRIVAEIFYGVIAVVAVHSNASRFVVDVIVAVTSVNFDIIGIVINFICAVTHVYGNVFTVVDDNIVAVAAVNHDIAESIFDSVIGRRAAQSLVQILETRCQHQSASVWNETFAAAFW